LLCFNEVDLDENEVKMIMRMNRSEKTEEEAQKHAGEIYDRLLVLKVNQHVLLVLQPMTARHLHKHFKCTIHSSYFH